MRHILNKFCSVLLELNKKNLSVLNGWEIGTYGKACISLKNVRSISNPLIILWTVPALLRTLVGVIHT